MQQLNIKHMIVDLIIAHNNGSYSLLVPSSCFISSCVHTHLTSATFIICKWHWRYSHFFNLSYFSTFFYRSYQVNNKIIDVLYIIKYYYTVIVCNIALRMGFLHMFTCRKLAVMHTNNQRLTNLYGSVILHI